MPVLFRNVASRGVYIHYVLYTKTGMQSQTKCDLKVKILSKWGRLMSDTAKSWELPLPGKTGTVFCCTIKFRSA